MEVSVGVAARKLGVSAQRVRALAATGRIPARKLGREWAIELERLPRQGVARRRGCPLSARSSWAVIETLSGLGPVGVSRSERLRARTRVRSAAILSPGYLSARANLATYFVHRGLLERLANDERIVLGGVSAASHHRADLLALDEVEGYIRADDGERLIGEYALRTPSAGVGANVLLRVPIPRWPFEEGERIVSRVIVAFDLIDAGDERSISAGRRLLAGPALAG